MSCPGCFPVSLNYKFMTSIAICQGVSAGSCTFPIKTFGNVGELLWGSKWFGDFGTDEKSQMRTSNDASGFFSMLKWYNLSNNSSSLLLPVHVIKPSDQRRRGEQRICLVFTSRSQPIYH